MPDATCFRRTWRPRNSDLLAVRNRTVQKPCCAPLADEQAIAKREAYTSGRGFAGNY